LRPFLRCAPRSKLDVAHGAEDRQAAGRGVKGVCLGEGRRSSLVPVRARAQGALRWRRQRLEVVRLLVLALVLLVLRIEKLRDLQMLHLHRVLRVLGVVRRELVLLEVLLHLLHLEVLLLLLLHLGMGHGVVQHRRDDTRLEHHGWLEVCHIIRPRVHAALPAMLRV
jgi:hypothetical protein